jgi:Carboxypeptidase regulatory-like domain
MPEPPPISSCCARGRTPPDQWGSGHVRRNLVGRCVLAVLLGCIALLLTAPLAAATGYGAVSGKVTGAVSKVGIEGIEVRIYNGENEWYPTTTTSGGTYSAAGIEAGEYKVKFIGTGTKYATQYYKEKLSYAAATTIKVEEGKETKEINAALSENGTISGEVKSASTNLELGDIEVTAYERNPPNAAIESVDTNSFGLYELTALSKGAYVVGFRSGVSGLDYAPQFYKEVPRFSENSEVYVDEHPVSDINAKLSKGASIAGVVTDAATHQPLANMIVYAVAIGSGEVETATATNAVGDYELVGLPSGTFEVVFLSENKAGEVQYSPQLYNDRSIPDEALSFSEVLVFGNHVEVTVPLTTSGINAALVREEPANTVAPTASGTPNVGQTLSCANGTWTGIESLTYADTWLRDGTAIAGATGATYVVQAADQGHGLACTVTATNKIASVSATSNTLAVPAAAMPPSSALPGVIAPAPLVVLSAAKLNASAVSAHVPVTCRQASCTGTIELTEQVVVKQRKGSKTISEKRTLILAKGSYSLAAGHSATIALRLTSLGKSALAKAKQHRLAATAVASVTGGKTVRHPVVLSQILAKHAG